ncbi:MAG: hypothetical protein Kow0069_28920 [Promethearchaeota archaeon]
MRLGDALCLVGFASLALGTTAAVAAFPGGYLPFTRIVSALGVRALNPSGAWAFNAGLLVAGVALAASFPSLFRPLAGRCSSGRHWRRERGGAAAFVAFGVVGCAGLALVGAFPADQVVVHGAAAGVAFLALYAAATTACLLEGGWELESLRGTTPAGVPLAGRERLAFWATSVAVAVTGVGAALSHPFVRVVQSGFPAWEWSSFLSLAAWVAVARCCLGKSPK